jgi:hypothetical protein
MLHVSRGLITVPVGLALALLITPIAQAKSALSDAEIKRTLIKQSIASYPGNCPCPYHAARNGSSCGRRSAWSRPGGYAPLCYPDDVTRSMVADYRASR